VIQPYLIFLLLVWYERASRKETSGDDFVMRMRDCAVSISPFPSRASPVLVLTRDRPEPTSMPRTGLKA
jgi:hypothetical protein